MNSEAGSEDDDEHDGEEENDDEDDDEDDDDEGEDNGPTMTDLLSGKYVIYWFTKVDVILIKILRLECWRWWGRWRLRRKKREKECCCK